MTERAELSAFVDKAHPPTDETIAATLATAAAAWTRLQTHLLSARGVQGSLHYMYGRKYGWAMRFQRTGRTVAVLYPNARRVTLQVVLTGEQAAAARAAALPIDVLEALDAAREYPEGFWVYLPVRRDGRRGGSAARREAGLNARRSRAPVLTCCADHRISSRAAHAPM